LQSRLRLPVAMAVIFYNIYYCISGELEWRVEET
jgi:hypothetical protein